MLPVTKEGTATGVLSSLLHLTRSRLVCRRARSIKLVTFFALPVDKQYSVLVDGQHSVSQGLLGLAHTVCGQAAMITI